MIKKIDYEKELAILKENKVYRVADLFFGRGNRWRRDRQTLKADPQYRDTILYDYLTSKTKERDYDCFKSVVDNHIKIKKYEIPQKDELVIHIRLGDVTVLRRPQWQSPLRRYSNIYQRINVDFKKISKITVVTALHFGANEKGNQYFYSQEAKEKSIGILKHIESHTNDLGYSLNLFSNENIDTDICYTSKASWFVRGAGGFSQLMASCLSNEVSPIYLRS